MNGSIVSCKLEVGESLMSEDDKKKEPKVVKIRPGARKHDRQAIMSALLPLLQSRPSRLP